MITARSGALGGTIATAYVLRMTGKSRTAGGAVVTPSGRKLSVREREELAALEKMSDSAIDLGDIPEQTDWNDAEVGHFYWPALAERAIGACGTVWTVEALKTRIVIRSLKDRVLVGSWRQKRDGSYQLFQRNQPVTVTDWRGDTHLVLARDRADAEKRCREASYYLIATPEYRADLDASMTELVLWSQRHKELTSRTPNVVGELGEFYAVKALALARASEREAGFDAWDRSGRRIQIKCRCVWDDESALKEKLPAVRRDVEWDTLTLVLVDRRFCLKSIYEMDRRDIEEAWPAKNGSKRERKLLLSIRQFLSKAHQVFGPDSAMPRQIGQVATHTKSAM